MGDGLRRRDAREVTFGNRWLSENVKSAAS